jgi:hypothetical protein
LGESEGNCALYATAWHPLAQFAERDGALETIVSENNDKKDILKRRLHACFLLSET